MYEKKAFTIFLFSFSKSVRLLDLKYTLVKDILGVKSVEQSDQILVQKARNFIMIGIYPQSCSDFAIFKLY